MKLNFTNQQVPPTADPLSDDARAKRPEALETAPGIPDEDSFKLMMDHKRSVARASLFIGMPLFLAMAIKNFVRGDNTMAFLDCVMLAILVLLGSAVIGRIKQKTESKIYAVCFRLFFAVMGVSLFYDIGFQSNFSRIEWCYIYPVLVFLAVGVKEGAIWVSVFYAMIAFLVLHFDVQGITLFQVQELRSRFLVSFFAVCILSLFLEYGFRRAEQRLLHHQRSLKESENRYRRAYERLDVEMQERRRAEEELLNAAQQWRTTFDSITDMVILLDLEGNILRCNMALKNFVGKPLNEIINRPCWEITPGTKTPIENSPFFRMKETLHRETTTFALHGRWFNVSVDPILDEAGNLIGAVNIMSDITERKQTEEALWESEDRYRDLVELSEYLICTHDLRGQILSVNQRGAALLGYDQRDLLNKNIRDFLVPEVRDEFNMYLDTIQKHGVAKGLMLLQTATGEKRVWEYHNTLRTEGVTEPIVRGMAHDITERKQIEDERERLVEDLQKALAEIKQLSGLLPICSGCKKIRDDKGYWNQIEEYISAHSEATFSHGLCPDCLKKLYPDL
jgi:PAS domain S-box-containing protein